MAFNLWISSDHSDYCDKCKKLGTPERQILVLQDKGRDRDSSLILLHIDCLDKAIAKAKRILPLR